MVLFSRYQQGQSSPVGTEDRQMDAAQNLTGRKFPGYTLAELKAFVAAGKGTAEMMTEIANREIGTSTHYRVPQLIGGKVSLRIGRM
jgi:hypothetical protein